MTSAAVGPRLLAPGDTILYGSSGRPPGIAVLHHAGGGWRRAPLRGQCRFNARVSRSRFGFPLVMPETDAGSIIAKTWIGLRLPLSTAWSLRRGMTCCARAVQ